MFSFVKLFSAKLITRNRASIAIKVAHDITKYVEQMRAMEREVAELRRERETWKKRAGFKEDGASSGTPEIQVEIRDTNDHEYAQASKFKIMVDLKIMVA